jgi:alpha-L-fucosidase
MKGCEMSKIDSRLDWFVKARFGLFVHFGLYSMLERGEWVMNRERIACEDYRKLADKFNPDKFDADKICDLAIDAGMKYVNLTTMHHDGFRLYDTELTDFNAKKACGRDLVEEFVAAARKRNLKVALYHSLNNWMDQPDAVAALEDPEAYQVFIKNTHARIKELVTKFNPIDVMWYDGWWPFNAEGWQSLKMNEMVREIQPHILFNGRNALPGDFATPEGHMSAPTPWRPWEGCLTFNEHWSFHRGDHDWKTPAQIIDLLVKAAQNKGNLLFNIGPKGDGSIPEESVRILEEVGKWVDRNGECLFDTDLFVFGLEKREDFHRADWSFQGPFTVKGNNLYQVVRFWAGETQTICGLNCQVKRAVLLAEDRELKFTQTGDKVVLEGLPADNPDPICPVIRFECDREPSMYLGGGMRVPNVPHPPYDPITSDIVL